jgi:hypothetical protein
LLLSFCSNGSLSERGTLVFTCPVYVSKLETFSKIEQATKKILHGKKDVAVTDPRPAFLMGPTTTIAAEFTMEEILKKSTI